MKRRPLIREPASQNVSGRETQPVQIVQLVFFVPQAPQAPQAFFAPQAPQAPQAFFAPQAPQAPHAFLAPQALQAFVALHAAQDAIADAGMAAARPPPTIIMASTFLDVDIGMLCSPGFVDNPFFLGVTGDHTTAIHLPFTFG